MDVLPSELPSAASDGRGLLGEAENLETDIRTAALLLTRTAADSGVRVDLDEVIAACGFSRTELDAELEAELAVKRHRTR